VTLMLIRNVRNTASAVMYTVIMDSCRTESIVHRVVTCHASIFCAIIYVLTCSCNMHHSAVLVTDSDITEITCTSLPCFTTAAVEIVEVIFVLCMQQCDCLLK